MNESMGILQTGDDFFTIGEIAILNRKTGHGGYDFDFRRYFECHSILSAVKQPVLLHTGAIENYAGIADSLKAMGMKLLISEKEHQRCSTIEQWYPYIKDRTPFTVVYDELPPLETLLRQFSFPVFVKGNRQTNRHRKSHCVIESAEAYEALREAWQRDPVLSWQKAAVREYVPLQVVDTESYPDRVPISYEFRFFYFEGKCMAYGPYWTMEKPYILPPDELREVLKLTDWAADRLPVLFPAIDVAKTANEDWIIIEINDAQESGIVGMNPIALWKNTIDAMQKREWLTAEELFQEGTVVLDSDPLANYTLEEMWEIARNIQSTQELVDAYAAASNKFWWVEDDEYDFEEGSEEYKRACAVTDAWKELWKHLENRVIEAAIKEGLFPVHQENIGLVKKMEPFMKKYGYRDGRGWWVRT